MYSNSHLKRSWVEIDLEQLKINLQVYKNFLKDKVDIIAVVKADAYGHGAVIIAKELNKIGIKKFAVSNVEEGIELRNANIEGDILILGYTPIENIELVIKYNLTQTLLNEDYIDLIIEKGYFKLKCEIAIDTGMNRIGLDANEKSRSESIIRKAYDKLKVTGIFTHLSCADSTNEENIDFTMEQIFKFHSIVSCLDDLKLSNIHILNSAGGISYFTKTNYNNLIRLGIILYGLRPSISFELLPSIKPILRWKSVVSMVHKVKSNDFIGYSRNFHVKEELSIATIPTGYADGYPRYLSNKGHVLINGQIAKIVGNICMDQFMIDITNIDNVEIGTEVILIDTDDVNLLSADNVAYSINTIGYEIISNISKRVPRIYIEGE